MAPPNIRFLLIEETCVQLCSIQTLHTNEQEVTEDPDIRATAVTFCINPIGKAVYLEYTGGEWINYMDSDV